MTLSLYKAYNLADMRERIKYKLIFFTRFLADCIFYSFISLYLKNKGFSGTELGVLLSFAPLFLVFSLPIWVFIDKKMSSKVIIALVSIVLIALQYFLSFSNDFYVVAIATICYSIFRAPLAPSLESIATIYCVNNNYEYASFRAWGSIGYIVAVVVGGFIYEKFSFLWLVIISSMGFISLFFMSLSIKNINTSNDIDNSEQEPTASFLQEEPFNSLGDSYDSRIKNIGKSNDIDNSEQEPTASFLQEKILHSLGDSYDSRLKNIGKSNDINNNSEQEPTASFLQEEPFNSISDNYDSRLKNIGKSNDINNNSEQEPTASFLQEEPFNSISDNYDSRIKNVNEIVIKKSREKHDFQLLLKNRDFILFLIAQILCFAALHVNNSFDLLYLSKRGVSTGAFGIMMLIRVAFEILAFHILRAKKFNYKLLFILSPILMITQCVVYIFTLPMYYIYFTLIFSGCSGGILFYLNNKYICLIVRPRNITVATYIMIIVQNLFIALFIILGGLIYDYHGIEYIYLFTLCLFIVGAIFVTIFFKKNPKRFYLMDNK